jgi:uncharacterized membrane protein YraQ (UPF0718 family)
MNWKQEYKSFLWITSIFLIIFFLPVDNPTFNAAIFDALELTKWYAREHVLLCLIPAFFIAGIISVFFSQASIIKYFGAKSKKWLAYLIASLSGTILAVCSCTVLPLFTSIHKRGAGLGPAITFLYSGPAINILAIILTARILGFELGIARIIGAIVFSIVIGIIMSFLYKKEEIEKNKLQLETQVFSNDKQLWQTAFHFFTMVAILIFATWSEGNSTVGVFALIGKYKWTITGFFGILLSISLMYILKLKKSLVLVGTLFVIIITILFPENSLIPYISALIVLTILLSFSKDEPNEWLGESWNLAKQILPLLVIGVLFAGFLLGKPNGGNGIIPKEWIISLVGGNSLSSNFFASIVAAFMYFATLTEIPILQGLLNNGMGQGPALALLLAGPALSLPNMLVIRKVIGTEKTIVYVTLVIIMATISGIVFGMYLS